jgi:hypothetical protein
MGVNHQPHDRRDGQSLAGGVKGKPIRWLDHFRLAFEQKHHRPSDGDDIEGLKVTVEHQNGSAQ